MDWFVILEDIQNWWTTTGGIATVASIITGAVGSIAGIAIKLINEYRRNNHTCPKHCITKKPLKSRKVNGKPKA